MSATVVIRNARIVNELLIQEADVSIRSGRIDKIGTIAENATVEIDAQGLYLLPGIIDDQVHFREPGLTHKANIYTESRAGVIGGVTSYMEMPNTFPPAVTLDELEKKYTIARSSSWGNYSFYLGATENNLDEIRRMDIAQICGIKIFMGSSTGTLLVDDQSALESIFSSAPTIIATHCEDEKLIRQREAEWSAIYGKYLSAHHHPQIRSAQGCSMSSSRAIELAKKHDARLHILHISTADETDSFSNHLKRKDKRITSEACVHHLYFDDSDYATLGNLIKCNPAIKSISDREAIREAVRDYRIDIIATDHAPHTWDEKMKSYSDSPSGLPLIQHSLHVMLTGVRDGWISLEQVVDQMCHAPSDIFRISDRGYIREGYFADLILLDPLAPYQVSDHAIWSKCGWSPFVSQTLSGRIAYVLVNGQIVVQNNRLTGHPNGSRMLFDYSND